ncbi:lamin tail domain-containing protein [bacterium]|nr:lamin tail domain-containing protein [bacterium]
MRIIFLIMMMLLCACKSLSFHPSAIPPEEEVLDNSNAPTSPDSLSTTIPPSNLSRPSEAIIYEIYYDDKVSDTDGTAFIELYATPHSFLDGYQIELVNGDDGAVQKKITLPSPSEVPENGFFVIADLKTNSTTSTQLSSYQYLTQFDPQNGPDSIRLLDDSGSVVDLVGYGMLPTGISQLYEQEAAFDAPAGSSLSRVSAIDTNNNAADFVINPLPSPGSADIFVEEEAESNATSDEIFLPTTEQNNAAPYLVKFTEVVTDPQKDWNDSLGGNDILFDEIPGTGTISVSDEYFEIKNFGNEVVNIKNWSVTMVDGTDINFSFSSPGDAVFFSSMEDDFLSLEANEVLVIGNPAGDFKNTITLTMLDDQGNTVDDVFVEDGNSTDEFDESFSLDDEENWTKTLASPGW